MELQNKVKETSKCAADWFNISSYAITRDEYNKPGSFTGKDSKNGAVYVYFRNKTALYIGETGRGVKERTHFKTSRHTDTEWWGEWNHMKFLPVADRTDRLLLELLLILSYAPKHNQKPGPRKFSILFR